LGVDDENPWNSFNTREFLWVVVGPCCCHAYSLQSILCLCLLLVFLVGVKYSDAANQ
jgi:hypothetical protein